MALMSFLIFVALQTDRNNVNLADWLVHVDPSEDFTPNINNRNARSKINDNVAQFKSTVFAVVVKLWPKFGNC